MVVASQQSLMRFAHRGLRSGIFSLAHKITVKHARVNGLITDEDLNTLSIDTSMIRLRRKTIEG